MSKTAKTGIYFMLCVMMAVFIFILNGGDARASVVTPTEYKFVINGQDRPSGTEFEMKTEEMVIHVKSTTLAEDATIQWATSNDNIVSLAESGYGKNFIKLVRKGPGYATITAVIKQGNSSTSISCQVMVDLSFDVQKTGLITATTTKEKILVINSIDPNSPDSKKQIYLKYVDYTPEGQPVAVSGGAIEATAVTWSSDEETVAKVDETGKVTAIGAGTATITCTTNTLSSKDKALSISMKVVVKPEFTLTYDAGGKHYEVHSVTNPNDPAGIAKNVPSYFTITSNATPATNLKWEVYEIKGNTKRKVSNKDKSMTYEISKQGSSVTFELVKAGTYEVYAFANEDYNANTNAPFAYMKLIVPIYLEDLNIVMNVRDTYSIVDNSNIPSAAIFDYSYIDNVGINIASIDRNTGVITAKMKGNTTLLLTYLPGQNLYDPDVVVDTIRVNITVIDGISLNMTSAVMYTGATLMLVPSATNNSEITWKSSDDKIATVEGGVVKALKPGKVIITASQKVQGVVKTASCEILIQQSVSKITVTPAETNIAIGGYTTLHATITPSNLSGIQLVWKSSNENVVQVVESSALTATIVGVAGGNAVISAINQDNVVVGYCHVTVRQPVTSIVLSETNITVDMSTKTLQLRASVYPENALNKAVTWTSTDPSKVKVDANGTLTILKPGAVSIIATSVDNPAVTAICNVNVNIPVVSITLDAKEKTMYVGQSERLTYYILPTNASNNSVTWTSTNNSVVTVDNTGKVTAKGVGTAVVMVKTLDGSHTAYCTITVKRVATSIKLDVSELKLQTNEYYYLKVTLAPKDSTDTEITWESSDTKVAVVDNSGKVTAKGAGNAIIMARLESGAVAYCKVTVTQQATGLLLNFSEKTIYIGQEFRLKASVSPSNATQLGVTWKSSNEKVATVSENGEVKGLVGGTALITATTVDGGFIATCVITVREPVTTIKLNHETYNVGVGKSFTLIATVESETATNQKLIWKSSNEKVATVNSKGKVTGKSLGYATITAIATDGTDVEATCEVRVVRPVNSVTLDKSYLSMLVGDSKKLKATIKPSNATYKTAKWTSSDEKIAIVDDDGVVTALKPGNVTITAEAKDNSGKKATCYVYIRERQPATGVTVADKKLVMVPGEEKMVKVVLAPATSTDGLTWSTDNAAIAKVDKNTGKITARSTGTAYVTVMTDSGKTATIEVTVIGLNITELVLEQYTTYPYQLVVEGATEKVSWSIDNPQIAVVTNGRVSARATGTATITASVNGRKLTCKLKVVKIGSQ